VEPTPSLTKQYTINTKDNKNVVYIKL